MRRTISARAAFAVYKMSNDKIKEFPKPKKPTPDDYFLPIYHECMEDHTSLKWLIQVHEKDVRVVCTDCAEWYSFDDLINKILGEQDA